MLITLVVLYIAYIKRVLTTGLPWAIIGVSRLKMKKLLVYLCVAIIIVSCGVSIYYVVRNDENIYMTASEEVIYMNKGEQIDIPVVHEKPHKKTTLTVTTSSEAVSINQDDWTMTANEPGIAMITVVSSNENFGPFEFYVHIGNGSPDYPYYVRNEEDLRKIGTGIWTLADNYEMTNDITLTSAIEVKGNYESEFTGTFSGSEKMYAINNLEIDGSKTSGYSVGLFAYIGETGRVENLTINNAKVFSDHADYTGIVAGRNEGVIGKVVINNSSIENTNADINGSYTGVITGDNHTITSYAEISLCTVTNTSIKAAGVAGGIAGKNYGGAITNNHISLNKVEFFQTEKNDSKYFGGIAGFTRDGGVPYYSETEVYTKSVISNNIVLFNKVDKTNGAIAGVFGKMLSNSSTSKGVYSMLVYSSNTTLESYIYNIGDAVITSETSSAQNYVVNISKNGLYQKATYTVKGSTWDFKNIWSITEDSDIFINYNNKNIDYQTLPVEGSVMEINNNATLKSAIDYMRAYPSANITYKITGNYEKTETSTSGLYSYTCVGNWIPIGTKENPFRGKIIANGTARIQIKGLTISDGLYVGFFGYTNNAEINNVNIVQADVSGTVAGALTGFNISSKINNCTVLASTICGKKYSGTIAGFSTGIITASTSTSNTVKLSKEENKSIYIGGIVGKSKGSINDCKSDSFTSSVTFESTDNAVYIGGIVGYIEEGYMQNNVVENFASDSTKYDGTTVVGGVVGYAKSSEITENIIIDSMQLKANQHNAYSVAAGLVGVLNSGTLRRSSTGRVILISYNSAGLVSYNNGKIEECYSGLDTCVAGKYAGGLVCNNKGSVVNSYSICELKAEKIEAGLTVYLWKDSSIDHCYTYCQYGADAEEAFAETSSNFKSRSDLFGSITNTIIVGSMDSKLITYSIKDYYAIRYIVSRNETAKVGIQVATIPGLAKINLNSENALLGQADVYLTFNNLEFDKEIWNFGNECIGNSPVLKNIKDAGCGVITQTTEEIVEDNTDTSEEAA